MEVVQQVTDHFSNLGAVSILEVVLQSEYRSPGMVILDREWMKHSFAGAIKRELARCSKRSMDKALVTFVFSCYQLGIQEALDILLSLGVEIVSMELGDEISKIILKEGDPLFVPILCGKPLVLDPDYPGQHRLDRLHLSTLDARRWAKELSR